MQFIQHKYSKNHSRYSNITLQVDWHQNLVQSQPRASSATGYI